MSVATRVIGRQVPLFHVLSGFLHFFIVCDACRPAVEGDLELLRWLHKSKECDLGEVSELGTSAAYLACLHDRPGKVFPP